MEWVQVATIAGSTIGACWYMHKESVKMHQNLMNEMGKEMKDFHGRLCTIEERYIQLMQKYWEKR